MDIGSALREVRERRGLSISQLSRTTKIAASRLSSIEKNELHKLPQPVFLRGFLRAYAREVGLDPDNTVREYFRQFEPPPEAAAAPPPAAADARSTPARKSHGAETVRRSQLELDRQKRDRATWLVAAAFLAAGAAGYVALRSEPDGRSTPAAPLANVAPARLEAAAPVPAPRPAGASSVDLLRLEIRADDFCWVSATVDGERVVYRLMRAGERQALDVRDAVMLRVGEPAAFAFSVDGRPGRLPGRPGQPVTFQITRQNYRSFVPD